METIGKITNNLIEREFYGQGFIYKNFDNFYNKSKDICYIPELSTNDNEIATLDNTVTYNYFDFLELAKGFLETNIKSKAWCLRNHTTAEDIAKDLFESLDWQHPESLLCDWETHEAYTD